MGADALGTGIGLNLGPLGQGAVSSAALLDADFRHNRYAFAGHLFADEAAFLTAVGGSRAGNARTIGPTVVGEELLVNGGFDTDVAGWSPGGSGADATPEWYDGRLQLTIAGSGTLQNRFGRDVALTTGKAYRFGGRPFQDVLSAGSANITFGTGLLFGAVGTAPAPWTAGQLRLGYGAAEQATQYVGGILNAVAPRVEQWDDFTVREAVPVAGHDHQALAGFVAATTAAAASGNQVLFQADDAGFLGVASERNRVRLVWDADRHLRLVVTRANVEQANLDLGLVEVSTDFEVGFSATANDFRANLDGGPIVTDSTGSHPGIAAYRIGRSNTGEAWGGSIERVTLFATPLAAAEMLDPVRAFAIHGDSIARGDHGTAGSRWYELLATGYTPHRAVHNAAAGGQDSTGLCAALLADTTHKRWTTIIMDRPNTGESAAACIANIKAAVAGLLTGRWLVVPPVDDSPEAETNGSGPAITAMQQQLLADPFFAGHTFGAPAQAAYLAALASDDMRTDGIHFNDAGQAAQAAYVRELLDTLGW